MTDPALVQTVCSVLCKRLRPAQAEEIITASRPLTVGATSLILREGDEAAGLLLFLKGTAEILKQGPDGGQRIATVEAPTVLGEMASSPIAATQRRSAPRPTASSAC